MKNPGSHGIVAGIANASSTLACDARCRTSRGSPPARPRRHPRCRNPKTLRRPFAFPRQPPSRATRHRLHTARTTQPPNKGIRQSPLASAWVEIMLPSARTLPTGKLTQNPIRTGERRCILYVGDDSGITLAWDHATHPWTIGPLVRSKTCENGRKRAERERDQAQREHDRLQRERSAAPAASII